jgi:ketosteroid isomerase-like protein
MTAMSHVRLVQDLYAAFGRGDVPGVLGAFAADIEWREAEGNPYQPGGKAWVGPDAVLQNLFMRMGVDWEFFTAQTLRYHHAGAAVIVEGRYTARHKQSAKSLDSQFCHVWQIRDGKIASFQQYTDTAQWQDVMQAR